MTGAAPRERAERLEALFQEALALLPEQRAELLEQRCGDDPELRERVSALLAEDERATRDELRPESLRDATLGRIGRYRLVRSLGEGGMGMVYLAEQEEPVRRLVALKTIRRGRLSSAVAKRFEAECQALATMDHPGIAKVFDGGTSDDGVPYFIMEYAPGSPITEHCDRVRMPLDARLELFARVCDAVQHAHEKGIVHRDLKPSNVIVEHREGTSRPRIVDFGIARALSAPLAREEPAVPLSDSLGTPAYMSPERLMAGDPLVDTRDDVYSLGVMLYQLVTGRLPVEAADRAERLRAIQRDPPAPSARLEALEPPELAAVAAARGATPAALIARVRGEIDALVLAALARERARRYGSAGALADDLRRFLRLEPLAALSSRPGYRAAKFLRRHRLSLGLGAALALALVLGLVGTWRGKEHASAGWAEAERRREAERGEREEADLLVRVFQEAIMMAQADDELKVADLLDRLAGKIRHLGVESPESEAALHAALGRSYLALGDDREALQQFESAYVRGGGLPEEDPFDRLDVLEGLIEATRRTGDRVGARAYVSQFIQLARTTFAGRHERLAEALETLLDVASGAAVSGPASLAALDEVLACLEDGIVRGDESGALARVLIESAAQLQRQRSPHVNDFLARMERRAEDLFPAGDVRRLGYLWSLLHVRIVPPEEPLLSPEETERAARELVAAADEQLEFGHWLRSDARRILARALIERVRTAAGELDRAAYEEARSELARSLQEALRAPRARRASLVREELARLHAARPEGTEPDPTLDALIDEARDADRPQEETPQSPER